MALQNRETRQTYLEATPADISEPPAPSFVEFIMFQFRALPLQFKPQRLRAAKSGEELFARHESATPVGINENLRCRLLS